MEDSNKYVLFICYKIYVVFNVTYHLLYKVLKGNKLMFFFSNIHVFDSSETRPDVLAAIQNKEEEYEYMYY